MAESTGPGGPTGSTHTPTAATSTSKVKKTSAICLICEKVIIDAGGKKKGEDAVFCEGTCQVGYTEIVLAFPGLCLRILSLRR